ncbi:MAG TPA: RNA methyltransferase [Gemmataceae bacterium]|jgi:tRNA/rRNA methyltransferase|nr:RNA methyltransferase [Gemmataceae bacterium]
MNDASYLEKCVVVLVRPHYAGNLGAVARAMRNFGANNLVLVNPLADPADRVARKRSTHGEEILNSAEIVADLPAALAGCVAAVATSARSGELIRAHAVAPAVCARRIAPLLQQGRVALVFGPEPSGLTNEELSFCQHLICIPTDAGYPALNLAQSAVICLYELRMACMEEVQQPSGPQPADLKLQLRMFAALERAFVDIHYLYGPRAPALMHGIRHLIGRACPTEMECKLLLGLARQIRWFAGSSPDRAEAIEARDESMEPTEPPDG